MSSTDSKTKRISLERLNKRRMSLPVLLTFESLVPVKENKTKKGVHFPLGVLMQQAVTNGDLKEIKQLVKDFGPEAMNEKEPSGLPPVMRAIFEGQLDSLQMLINAGADVSVRDLEDWNVLHVAAAMDDYKAAELIICSCKDIDTMLHSENMAGERPIDLAENIEMARLLLDANLTRFRRELENQVTKSSTTDSSIESEDSVIQLVQDYYRKHNECHSLNTFLKNNTPYCSLLHLAATKNYAKLTELVCASHLISTETRDKNGWTPLHVATYFNNIEVVLVLIGHKANTNALTNSFEKATDLSHHELILSVLSTRTLPYNHMNSLISTQ